MRALYVRIILLSLLSVLVPVVLKAQCIDSAYFKIKTPYCVGTAAAFTNQSSGAVTGYFWNFGDPVSGAANTSTAVSPSHSFSSAGTYTVCLIAKYANAACNDTFCTNVVIENPPSPSFTFSPANQCSSQPVQFTNTTSGSGLTYKWNFGDPGSGGSNSSTATNPQHTFAAFGSGSSSYTVKLVVTNAGGCSDSTTRTVNVFQRPNAALADPITNFNNCSQATSGNPSFTITVNNTSSTNAINLNYIINWGDGTPDFNSATFTSTSHTYAALGVYTLTLVVAGVNGCTDTVTYKVLNISNPSIGFSSPGSTAGCGPKTYCFAITAFQNNDITTFYRINFGDGTPIVNLPHPPPDSICHTYTTTSCGQPGNQFTARITAIDACDSTASTVNNIKIFMAPKTGIKVLTDTIGCVNQTFIFQNKTTGAFNNLCSNTTTFTWDFGDGSPTIVTTSLANQSHAYTNPGIYWVKLSSANYCSPNVVDSQKVCVNPPPLPSYALSDTTGCAPLTITTNNTTITNNTCGNTIYTWTVLFNSSVCTPKTGQWSFAGGSNLNSINPTFIFRDPGSYTITMKVDNKCIATLSQNIIVKDTPDVTLTTVADFCGTASVAPLANFNDCYGTITTYSWSFIGGSPLSSNVQLPGTVTYTDTGTFNIIAEATNECGIMSDTVTFNVHPIPTVVATTDPDTICDGQSATLIATGALSYAWSPLTGLSVATGDTIRAKPSVPVTYIVVGTDAFGCLDSDSVTLHVNPNLVLTVNPVSPVICAGDSVLLTASGAALYKWSPLSGLTVDTGTSVYVHPTVNTVYTVIDSSFTGCPAIGIDTVKVNPKPTVNILPAAPVICPNSAVKLKATGAVTYAWAPSSGLSATTGDSVIASPVATTSYTITGTDANGCTNTKVVTVTVNLTIPVGAGPDTIICVGSSITLTPSGAVNYLWNPSLTLSCTACTNPVANPLSTSVYTVTGTDVNGCTGTDSVKVNVSSSLSVSVGPDKDICPGSTTQLNVVSPGATSWQWIPANGLSCSTCPNPVATPLSNTTYIVNTSDGVCKGADTINVNLYSAPVANAGPDAIICIGGDTLLNPSGGLSYSWSPATGLSCTACQNPSAGPSLTTIYTVTVSDINGCTAIDNVTINVIDTLQVNAGPDQSICKGSSAQLNVTVPGATNYLWTPSSGLSCTTCTNPVAAPGITTTYAITASNSACSGSDTVTINVVAYPVANAGTDVTICEGDFIAMNASGGATYNWAPFAGISNPFIANPFASPTVTTTYVVTVTNAPCSSTDTVIVTVDPLPVVTVSNDTLICEGNSVNLNASGAVIYSWSPISDLNNAGISNPTSTPPVTVTYIVTGSDAQGCSASASVTISVVQIPDADGGPDKQICYGESTELQATGGLSYLWLPSLGLSDSTSANPTASPTNNITYTVFVSNGSVCPITADTVQVIVHPLPNIKAWPDTTIVAGTTVTLNVTGSGKNYVWYPDKTLSCANCTNPDASPSQSTSYIVTTTDSIGCRNSDTVQVDVEDIITMYFPNTFTPYNRDLVNDVFSPYGIGIFEFEFFIFNRWGEQIFKSTDPKVGWDGTYKGDFVLEDVYIYLAKATSITGKTITRTGSVTVLRQE